MGHRIIKIMSAGIDAITNLIIKRHIAPIVISKSVTIILGLDSVPPEEARDSGVSSGIAEVYVVVARSNALRRERSLDNSSPTHTCRVLYRG